MSGDLSKYASYAPAWIKTRWAKILGGLLLTALILALAAPYLLDVDRYRGAISDMISMQTGRKVTLGKIHATVLPRVGFSVDGFQMANPPNFAQGQLVSAEEIHGALAFWPLVLRRELRVISLEMVEPRLMLLEDDRGRDNYTFPPRRAVTAPSTRQSQTGASRSLSLMIDQVTMHDAAVFYGTLDRRNRPSATLSVSGLNVELHQLALQPLRVHQWQADAELGGAQLILAGWYTPVLFDSGIVTLRDGKLDSSFTVQFGKAARIEGTVTVPNVEDAVPQFDVKTADLDLNALLSGTTEPAPARGGGNLPPGGGNLNPAPPRGRPRPAAPLPATIVVAAPAAGPSRLVAQGHLAAEHIHQNSYSAGPLTADLRIYNDRSEIWPFTLRFAGGNMQLTARTDRRQVPQRFSANVQVRDVNTERLLQDSQDLKGKFAGTAELEMQLIGSIEPRWPESLTGTGQFAIRNGRIAGFNLAGSAQSIANLAGVTGDTPFTRIAGDIAIRDSRVASRQIHMDSPRGTLDLKGSCGFYGSLNYEGQMIAQFGGDSSEGNSNRDILAGVLGNAIAHNIGPAQITVPFVLAGTLQKPQLRPGRSAAKFTRSTQTAQPAQSPQPQDKNSFSFPNLFGR